MSYQVYFSNLDEENRALVLTLLRLKDEAGRLEPGESEMLTALRGHPAPERRGSDRSRNGVSSDSADD